MLTRRVLWLCICVIGCKEHAQQDDADFESPRKARRHQSSSDESSEDGEIDKREEELDAERKEEQVTVTDLSKARITRDMLAKYCLAPWFEDFVKGAFIYLMVC